MIYETQFRSRAIILAYRHLFRNGLKVINYLAPDRYVLRDIMRSSFRLGHMDDFDPVRVMNTIKFLERAAKSHSFERKIVTNLLYVRYYQYSRVRVNNAGNGNGIALFEQEGESLSDLREISYLSFDSTLFMLNESLGLCLR